MVKHEWLVIDLGLCKYNEKIETTCSYKIHTKNLGMQGIKRLLLE